MSQTDIDILWRLGICWLVSRAVCLAVCLALKALRPKPPPASGSRRVSYIVNLRTGKYRFSERPDA